MSGLSEEVLETIRARGLLPKGRRVLVAVSGGADSMVLLRVLHDLAPSNRWALTVAHFNHCLRGRASDADERLVRRTAARLKLPIAAGSADVRELARSAKVSVEMAARKARHEFLARTAAQLRASTVALAHHADDRVELFFLRLFRGAGPEGLAGMKWRSPSPANSRIELVRPLLDISKSVLLEFAARNRITFRDDQSNAGLDIQRNRIRNELLPLLRKRYQPGLDSAIARTIELAGSESAFVGEVAREALRRVAQDRRRFEALHVAIQRRCIQLELIRLGIAPSFDLVESLRGHPGRPVTVAAESAGQTVTGSSSQAAGAIRVQRQGWRVTLLSEQAAESFSLASRGFGLWGGLRRATFGDVDFQWSVSPRRPGAVVLPRIRQGVEVFDAEAVGPRVCLRYWRPGDRFQPIGMKNAAKLQDLFINQKVPRARRHGLIVATTASGELFWVEGLRIAEHFKLAESTNRRLIWRWRRH